VTIRAVLIQLYVLRQLLVALAFAAGGLAAIVVPTIAVQAISKLGAIRVELVVSYLPLVVSELVPSLLPMAFLLAVVATYGRLAADRELIAIQMAGVHPARLALPGLLVALPLVFATDYLLGTYSPGLKFEYRNVERKADLSRFVDGMSQRNVLNFGNNVLKSESTRGNVKTNVQLDMELDDGQLAKIQANEARIDVEGDLLIVRMKDMRLLTESASADNAAPVYTWRLSQLFPSRPRDNTNPKFQTTPELQKQRANPELEPAARDEIQYEIHRRHALSATYLLFLLLGLPTGIVLRSSTQLGAFTGAIGYALVYYVLAMRLGKVLAENGALPPVLAAWATNGLFLLVGAVFFVRTLWR
jgi:lipopolysaccharide export LptBFGC system permease protein LptF